jgi:prepilin-type processing-associated H-X9-DG protein
MNAWLPSCLVLAACAGATPDPASPAQGADTERVDEAGRVKLWVPPGWSVDDSSAESLVVTAPDQTVSLDVTMLDGKDLATALVTVAAAAVIGYDDLQLVGSPVSGQINGMNALFQDGHGKYRGRDVELSVGVIDTPAEKYLLVVGETESDAYAEHEHVIREFMQRIKPI